MVFNRYNRNDRGFSLAEVLVAVAVTAVLIGLAVPAAKKMNESLTSSAGIRNVINAALANARAEAIAKNTYAGLRFQQDLRGNQYMIFIIHDPGATGLANGFRAMKGKNPVKMPESAGVMDLYIVKRLTNAGQTIIDDEKEVGQNDEINTNDLLNDATTFSIIFSSSGDLVRKPVQVRNKDGAPDGDNSSTDKVFNTDDQVDNGMGLFYQDDYFNDGGYGGFGKETGRASFIIYDKKEMQKVFHDHDDSAMRPVWDEYLEQAAADKRTYINPHTGEIINK